MGLFWRPSKDGPLLFSEIGALRRKFLVQLGGLEPPTFGATIRRSNQLSYSCMPPGGQCDNAPAPDLNRPDLALTSPNRPARSSRGLPLREHRAEALRNPLVSAKESVTLMRLRGPWGPGSRGGPAACIDRPGRQCERLRHTRVERHRGEPRAGLAVGS